MSRWVRGIYNAAANFNMSRSLRAAAGRILDRDAEHVREVGNECDKCEQSCQSSKSDQSSQHACACHSSRTCNCADGDCADNDSRGNNCFPSDDSNIITNNVYAKRNNTDHSDSCTCAICIDYRDYTASIRTEGQGAGSWIRISDESGTFKQSNPDATGSVERVTGIPTGVTI